MFGGEEALQGGAEPTPPPLLTLLYVLSETLHQVSSVLQMNAFSILVVLPHGKDLGGGVWFEVGASSLSALSRSKRYFLF